MKQIGDKLWEVAPADISLPHRDRNAHKGNFGRVVILGGAVGYSGAPVLAAKAAVRTGAGLVTVLVPEPVWPVAAAKLECAMPRPLPAVPWAAVGPGRGTFSRLALDRALETMSGADAALIGPGLSREPDAAWVSRKLTSVLACPLILDADGINALVGHIEFARLTGRVPGEDRVGAARAFAAAHQCVLVLKGHRTVTALPDGRAYVNTTGNPGMAAGGSGDVPSGLLLALLGQGIPPEQAAPWAVCLHGQAGDLAAAEKGEYSMAPTDLMEKLPETLKRF